MRAIYLVAFSFLLLWGCSEKPADLIEKARLALESEDREGALEYLWQAFELSLGDEFYFRPIEEKFSQLYVSRAGNKVLLVPKNNLKNFLVTNETGQKLVTGGLPSEIKNASLSPSGSYLIFLVTKKAATSEDQADLCDLIPYDMAKEEFFTKPVPTSCSMKPAIDDQGSFPYAGADPKEQKDAVYWYYDDSSHLLKQKPDKPVTKMPAYMAFYFNKDNQLFFTFGSAGVYKFYTLDKTKLKLIHKDVTTGKITYDSKGMDPGVIIGGAGNIKMHFYDPKTLHPTNKTWGTNTWSELVILDDDSRFYTENSTLYEFQKGKDKELPFWASQLHALKTGRLLFLSATGAALVYAGNDPSAGSIAIYQKGAELDARK